MPVLSATGDVYSALQSAYSAPAQSPVPKGSKFANVDPTLWKGTWTATDLEGCRHRTAGRPGEGRLDVTAHHTPEQAHQAVARGNGAGA